MKILIIGSGGREHALCHALKKSSKIKEIFCIPGNAGSDSIAKIKYLPNNFEIIQDGDYVICAISGKKIPLEKLNYWNVEEQEAYFSYLEASIKREKKN